MLVEEFLIAIKIENSGRSPYVHSPLDKQRGELAWPARAEWEEMYEQRAPGRAWVRGRRKW